MIIVRLSDTHFRQPDVPEHPSGSLGVNEFLSITVFLKEGSGSVERGREGPFAFVNVQSARAPSNDYSSRTEIERCIPDSCCICYARGIWA